MDINLSTHAVGCISVVCIAFAVCATIILTKWMK